MQLEEAPMGQIYEDQSIKVIIAMDCNALNEKESMIHTAINE